MIINTENFINMSVKERCLHLLGEIKNPLWVDQELLNILCWEKIKLIDERWNFQYHALSNEKGKKPKQLELCLAKTRKDQYIVHYSGVLKPWGAPEIELAHHFWKYARQTEFYEEIIFRNASRYGLDFDNAFNKYLFPFDKVSKESNIILYGMGNVGQAFYAQMKTTNYCNIVTCVDKNHRGISGLAITIQSPEILKMGLFDYVIVCIENESIRSEIVEELVELGVAKEKIVAENPIKK